MFLSRISIRVSLIVTVVALGALALSIVVVSGRIYGEHVIAGARAEVAERLRDAIAAAARDPDEKALAPRRSDVGADPGAAFGLAALEQAWGAPLRVLRADGSLVYQSAAWPHDAARAPVLIAEAPLVRPDGQAFLVRTAKGAAALHARIEQTQYAVFFATTAITLLAMLIALALLDRIALTPWRSLLEQLRLIEGDENELGRPIAAGGNAEAAAIAQACTRLSAHLKGFYEQLERVAFTDPLTQLPNRSLLYERLERAAREARAENRAFALFVMDLDRFKEVNGSLGHRIGDALLKQAGVRMRSKLRETDTLARIGGDEFAVLLRAETAKQADLAARMLLQSLRAPFMVETHQLEMRASIGIALCPDHGVDAESLLRNADLAMYAAKHAGGGHMFYDAQMNRHRAAQLALKGDLRRAIEEEPGQFVLHFQPKIGLQSDRVAGIEALVRWRHPGGRLILPETFVPLLEQTGLIRNLSAWVVKEALRMALELRSFGFELPIALNAWGRDLHESGLDEELADQLAQHPDLTQWIEVEIGEPSVIADTGGTAQVLSRLAELGFRLVIDHFGTGYSSLAQLKKLPVQAVKIDKSFVASMVKDENDAAIVSSSIELAHHLGLEVIAEGVDDDAILARLRARGCDAVQGLYLSRPLPGDEVIDWLAKSDWGLPPRMAYRA